MQQLLGDYFTLDGYGLRPVQDADIDTLVPLINEAFSEQESLTGEPRTNPEHLRNRISETDFYVIERVVEISPESIGSVYLEPKDKALHFGLLTLAPPYRGKGIASAVMNAIDAYAQDHAFDSIDLHYLSQSEGLKSYYERYGFTLSGDDVRWGDILLVGMRKELQKI